MSKLFDLANDWRDTVLYIGAAVVLVALVITGKRTIHQSISDAFDVLYWREWGRMIAWQMVKHPINHRICALLLFTILLTNITFEWATTDQHLPSFIMLAMYAFIALILCVTYRQVGGYKIALRAWWKQMFDWPRKQKPPKKWDSITSKIKRWYDKFAPDFIPSPVGR